MAFNSIDQWMNYIEQCMYAIEDVLESIGLETDDVDVLNAIECVVADAIWAKTRSWDKKDVYFDGSSLCIDGCSFKAEAGDEDAYPAEMEYPDMSNVENALADIGLQLIIDWNYGVDYTECYGEYGRFESFTGDIKAALKLVNADKFIKFAKLVKGIVNEDTYSCLVSESIIGIDIDVKKLVYKELSPMAQDARCKLLLLDQSTYKSYGNELERKMQSLGIQAGEYRSLRDAIDEYGCIALLKPAGDCSVSKVLACFAPVGLQQEDLNALDVDGASMWWFAVRLHGVNDV